ncbi:MFS transporter [Curtobacterium sp. MCJR17_043]|nr:MFS transporter [Curtobacterium sp. MCJR17_043]WIB35346.1 MFS transporter [Curtobacterium sp. MCJR17_043]
MTSTTATRTSVFAPRYLVATIGMVAIVAVSAFQNLAMTTIMPVISEELHGETLYSLSFAAPLAAGVPGMVLAGNWTDRAGGRVVAWVSASLFAIGTAVVMVAPTMPVFLAGRLVEGFGAGAIDVVLYVLVARVFPADLHGSVFAGFAAAWVVPALVGPAVAGIVTDALGWHWVFAGALVIAVVAFACLVPTLRHLRPPAPEARPPWQGRRIAWSVAASAAVLLLNTAPDLPLAVRFVAVGVGLVGAWTALRPLLPRRTFTGGAGLPSVVLLRGVLAAGFFGSEAYVPFLLQAQHGLEPSAAGLALTVAALSWAGASWLHGRLGGAAPPGHTGLRRRTGARPGEPAVRARGRPGGPARVGARRRLVRRRRRHGGGVPADVDAHAPVLARGRRRIRQFRPDDRGRVRQRRRVGDRRSAVHHRGRPGGADGLRARVRRDDGGRPRRARGRAAARTGPTAAAVAVTGGTGRVAWQTRTEEDPCVAPQQSC